MEVKHTFKKIQLITYYISDNGTVIFFKKMKSEENETFIGLYV